MLRGSAGKLEAALTERGIPHDVKEYPGATHGFANRKSLGPLPVLSKVMGMPRTHGAGY